MFFSEILNQKNRATRRSLLKGSVASVFAAAFGGKLLAATAFGSTQEQDTPIESFSAAGSSTGTARVAKIIKSTAEWRAQLSAATYRVTREEGTEVPYSGKYWNYHADGLYRCICCDTALFDSRTKFESGTGWPSFWKPISSLNVTKNCDSSFGMHRDAIACSRCAAHLGHVFDDGPKPTGLRYCMNSVALNFAARG